MKIKSKKKAVSKKQVTKNKVENKKQLNQFKKCLLNITYLI